MYQNVSKKTTNIGDTEWYINALHEDCIQHALDNYLSEFPYLDGYTPSQADAKIHQMINKITISQRHQPHLARWKKHLKSFNNSEKLAFRQEEGGFLSNCQSKTTSSFLSGYQVGE